jgi:Xaa-Pro aminopeptidase
MTTRRAARLFIVCCLVLLCSLTALGQLNSKIEELTGIRAGEYGLRRALLLSKMEPNSIAVFRANDPRNRSNDVNYQFKQDDSFFYLTGCDEIRSYLALCPDGIQVDSTTTKEVFFIRPTQRSASGTSLGIEGAKSMLGFEFVLQSSELLDVVKRALAGKKILYYYPSIPDIVYDPLMEKRYILSREVKGGFQAQFPNLEVKSLAGVLSEMRSVKSPSEIGLIQKAIDATATGDIEAMKSAEPDMYEYELQAIIEYCFAKNGAEYPGFPSIVGSGPNSCILHYEANRRQMQTGDVVVMDIGAEYHGYTADVTRTIPVNGKFSPAQREIYEIVLKAQEEAIKEFKPGASSSAPSQRATDVIADGLMKLGIIKEKSEVRRYYMHGLSHNIGLDVHDVGRFSAPYAPGMILTVEPGVYIPAESPCDKKYWNIGVRIEDDVLITDSGCRVLSAGAPKTVNEIESLMKQKGIGNVKIGTK